MELPLLAVLAVTTLAVGPMVLCTLESREAERVIEPPPEPDPEQEKHARSAKRPDGA